MPTTRVPLFGRSVTRRQALKTAGGLMVAPAILSHTAHAAGTLEDEVVFASNGGAYQKAIENELFPSFANKTGVKKLSYVVGQGPENIARLRVQRGRPGIDVIWLAGSMVYVAADEGLLDTVSSDEISNLKYVPSEFVTEPTSVPVTVTFMSILYNREIFAEKGFPTPTSWLDLWDPRYKGHVGSFSSNSTGQVAVLTMLAKMLTGDYKNLDPAFAKMRELRSHVVDFFASPGALDKAIQQREVWICATAVQGAVQHARNGMPIDFVHPKEGVVGYTVNAGVVKNGPNPKAARAWVDHLLAAETQAKMAEVLGYTPVNRLAKIPDTYASFYPDMGSIFVPDWRYLTGQLPSIVDRWNRVVEG